MEVPFTALVCVKHSAGLHARPAAKFVKLAGQFPCRITVRKLNSDKPPANAKSPLSILTLGVNQGEYIEIAAQGDQAREALEALVALVERNFDEGTEV